MASASSARPEFTFGVEIELLLKPRVDRVYTSNLLKEHGFQYEIQPTFDNVNQAAKAANRTAIRNALAKMLIRNGIHAGLHSTRFDLWTVKEEGSLTEVPDARGGGYCKPFFPRPYISFLHIHEYQKD
jgi:hypothetical protein